LVGVPLDGRVGGVRPHWRLVGRRFLRHRLAVAGLVVLAVVIVAAFVGPLLWRYDHTEIISGAGRQGPSLAHPLGTDNIGHDHLAQVLRGTQRSVQIMLLVATVSTVVGVAVGAVAGYYRGWVDALLSRVVDLTLTIPLLAVAILLARRYQDAGNWQNVGLVIALLAWTPLARVVRAEALSLREQEFVEAARALGASDRRIIVRHILPNLVGSVIVSATLTMAAVILVETTLSFLGFGVTSPDTSLGRLVEDGRTAARTAPWLFYAPGLAIVAIVLSINFVGDGLRDAFDPRQGRRHG
jgi:ABC-type dipeptide/oligopeptide/nickel transport system permease subunit